MGFYDPKFPVRNAAPGFTDCVYEFRVGDYAAMSTISGGSVLYGWFVGKPLRPQSAAACGAIGGMAAFMYAYQNSYGRLMGYKE
mmetsp:Transcript_93743/g.268268  ORF Transcript_93743/g.268268 Transcript_93743/m.268268 type:complete len:84 (-) Transcript_93743:407-658(-)|eukprot:CAMPEP_0182530966 /NCGR_PEP_ID=MMETSP1323-20130603/7470_1 /TAXON_ID=236787 /ORGANISM="Florenciella parvula, Strain RCC1693" /LENGTH=83 /DNA_ID=CAMNT_0024740403 /DNA_START=53 /DNA_END=304 /DNA_ORIENTATION=+